MAWATRSRAEALRDVGRRAAEVARTRLPGGPAVFESVEREYAAGSGLLAGGVAYRLFLWLLPLGLVAATIASFWADAGPGGIEETARQVGLPGAVARSSRTAFETGSHSRWYLLATGIVLLLWFGASAVRALRIAHAIAWAMRATRMRRAVAAPGVLPHADAPWSVLLPGAALVALGLHLAVVLDLAPKLHHSTELYGSLGAATVILLWLYLTARLFVSAAFLNATLWDRKQAGHG